MLIVTPRTDHTVWKGDEVPATVLGVTGNQVRLGIKAPREGLLPDELAGQPEKLG